MKCIKNQDKYMKVSEDMATQKVKDGWSYCPKSEFKKAHKADQSSCQVVAKPKQNTNFNKPKKVKKPKKEEATADTILK